VSPIDATYLIRWPATPTLQIGETLMTSKRGTSLAVKNMARVESIYDDLTPGLEPVVADPTPSPIQTLARLYDPLSTRTLKLDQDLRALQPLIARVNRAGKEVFTELPFTSSGPDLRYDPIHHALEFSGILDELSYAGEPLLLPNVLSSRERDVHQATRPRRHSPGPGWSTNSTTSDPQPQRRRPRPRRTSQPDQALRLGLAFPSTSTDSTKPSRNPDTGESPPPSPTRVHDPAESRIPKPLSDPVARLSASPATNVVVPNRSATCPRPSPPVSPVCLRGIHRNPVSALQFSGATNSVASPRQIRPVSPPGPSLSSSGSAVIPPADSRRCSSAAATPRPAVSLAVGFTSAPPASTSSLNRSAPTAALVSSVSSPPTSDQWVHWACTYDPVENLRQILPQRPVSVAQDNPPGGAFEGTGNLTLGQ
jgi:hypothetical protein